MSSLSKERLLLRLWQLEAVRALSVRRYLTSKTLVLLLILAFGPVLAVFAGVVFVWGHEGVRELTAVDERNILYISSYIVNAAFIHFTIIFSAIAFGMSVMREELDDQTFHLLCMQPIPRWGIVAGKTLGFMTYAIPLIFIAIIVCQFLIVLPYGLHGIRTFYFRAEIFQMYLLQFLVVFIGLLVYSSFFLMLSVVLKSPVIILMVYGWELGSNFLPGVLKNYSIAFYLREMLPGEDRTAGLPAGFIPPETPGTLQIVLVLVGVFVVSAAVSTAVISRKPCIYGSS